MAAQHGKWIWYELITPDFAGAKAFYEAVVGWTMTAGTPEQGDYGFIARPDGSMTGGVLTLTDEMTAGGARPVWLGYISVADADEAASAITAAGGTVLMPPRDVPMAGRIAMVADGSGAPFYIMAPTPPPQGGESTAFSATPLIGSCGWNELMAADPHAAAEFYTGQFGWTLPEPMDMGEMGKYQFVATDGVTTGAIMGLMPGVPASMWDHYFWVPSIAAAKTAIETNGGTVINGPMQVPGDGWIIQAIDPQGAMLSLVGEA